MAEVYAARALGEGGFQKLVALKRMRPELAEDARFVAMFLDEGRLAANIASPNVVSTLDLGRADDNSLYLVMELVTGVALSQLIQETLAHSIRVPVPIAVDVIARAAQGLHAAHEARSPLGDPLEIVHRDCSPHNILVDIHGQVKITDFGIAKAMERQTQSHAGEMKGKLCYLSPEQARGRDVDRRTDIFILGIVCWEVLAGRMLFDSENAVEALHKIATMPIPALTDVRSDLPQGLSDAVAQALAREPDERFSTANAFGNALLNSLGQRPPPPTELGQFVQRYGGPSLREVQGRIRQMLTLERGEGALSGVRARQPEAAELDEPKSSAEYPIPLLARAPVETLAEIDVAAAAAARHDLLGDTDPGGSDPGGTDPAARARADTLPSDHAALAPARPASIPPRESHATLALEPPPRAAPAPTTPEPAAKRRSNLLPIGLGLALLAGLLGALGAWLATQSSRETPEAPTDARAEAPPAERERRALDSPETSPESAAQLPPEIAASETAPPETAPPETAPPETSAPSERVSATERGSTRGRRASTGRAEPERGSSDVRPSRLGDETTTVHGDRFDDENEIWGP